MNFRERKEFKVFRELLHSVPGLEACLVESLEEEITDIADLVCSPIQSCVCLAESVSYRSRKVQVG